MHNITCRFFRQLFYHIEDFFSISSLLKILVMIFLLLLGLPCVAQMVKNLPAIWKTQVQSPGWEDTLEKEMATHFSILARRIPWTEEPCGL